MLLLTSPVLCSPKINNAFFFKFQESSATCPSSPSPSFSSSSDFLQRASAKRKLDDGSSPSIIGGGNSDGALSVDGKGDVKKVRKKNCRPSTHPPDII